MPLTAGSRLGPYEVIAKIGEGGMGEVYRARDLALGRDVAIKVLPEQFAADPERLARFQREAKTLAALNHPHIAAIYGLEGRDKQDGREPLALVMEFVEGPTLADFIASHPKGIPFDDAMAIARQIIDALEAAHDQGIVHRDLKPANIKVRTDGTVKVLDFGLAKALTADQGDPSLSASPTFSVTAATRVGTIIGTAAYMAPEQAKGRAVDRRADVWAFGAVLYEMLSGRKTFSGEDVSDTLAAVLRAEPDWTALPVDIPARARQVLRVCLEKDPKKRVRDMSAVRLALDGAFESTVQSAVDSQPARSRALLARPWPWAVAAFAAGALATAAAFRDRTPPAAPGVERFEIATPANASITGSGTPSVLITPDGSRIVYRSPRTALEGPLINVLFVRDLDALEPVELQGTLGVGAFFCSPDGQWIGFADARDRALKRISVHGGPVQTITALTGVLRGAGWGPRDDIVFATSDIPGLQRVSATGGQPEVLTTIDASSGEIDHRWPAFAPDGETVLFTAWGGSIERSRIVALSLTARQRVDVVQGGTNPVLTASGHLIYRSGEALHAARFDLATRSIAGSPVRLIEAPRIEAQGGVSVAVSSDGTLVYSSGESGPGPRTLVWVDRQGRQEEVRVPARSYTYARLSPDGTKVALDARDQQLDIWIWDLVRETLQRLTTDPGINRSPVWTPDGQRVAFTSAQDGAENIYWKNADGSGAVERLSPGQMVQGPQSFSPDGKRLIFITPLGGPYDLGVITLEGERREEMLLAEAHSEGNGVISPDGRWLAYESAESGSPEVYLVPFPDVRRSKLQVSTRGGTRPLWSRDGRELFYYIAPDTIMAVPVSWNPNPVLGRPVEVVKASYAQALNTGRHYDVSPDGRRFLLLKDVLATEEREAPRMLLVKNWFEELNRLAPPVP